MSLSRYLLAAFVGAAIIGGFGSAWAQSSSAPTDVAQVDPDVVAPQPNIKPGIEVDIFVGPDGSTEVVCMGTDCFCADPTGESMIMEQGQFKRIDNNCATMVDSDGSVLQAAIEDSLEILGIEAAAIGIPTDTTSPFDSFLDQLNLGTSEAQTVEDLSPLAPTGQ